MVLEITREQLLGVFWDAGVAVAALCDPIEESQIATSRLGFGPRKAAISLAERASP